MKRWLYTYQLILLALLVSCGDRNAPVDKSKLFGNDYRLFQGTPVWDLAKAVQDGNASEIKEIVKDKKLNIDFSEPRFGSTLLMLAVMNQSYVSCKTLLDLGASPNKKDRYNGTSAMIYAAGVENYKDDNTAFLKLMLAHGGNPNDEEVGNRQEGNTTRDNPLLVACRDVDQSVSPMGKVRVLVEAGANINYKNEFDAYPLKEALINKHYDVTLYLLQEGVDYLPMLFDRGKFSEGGKKIHIADLLRESLFPLDSKEYKQKMEVVAFLKGKGIDYRKVPIPDYAISEAKELYPNNWQSYLEKY